MTKSQARKRLASFLQDRNLTFAIKQHDNEEWVAQCNEIPAIMTCGKGYDIQKMHALMQDAILTAAGIPSEHCDGLLKTVKGTNPVILPSGTEIELGSSIRPFESSYRLTEQGSYATTG